MKHLIATLILYCTANLAFAVHGNGNDDSTTADERASCNASFHAGCPSEFSGSSSTTVAAPAGPLGSTAWEALLVMLAAAASLRTNRVRRRPSPQALE